MKTSAAKSGRSAKIVTRLAPRSSHPSYLSRAGTSRLAIPPSLTASSTVWFTTLIASKCAASPCGRSAIRRRTRRKNEPKSTTLSAKWGFQCAGLNRHEAENAKFLRERISDPLGPESCAATARDEVKRRQGYRRGGLLSCENIQPGRRRR